MTTLLTTQMSLMPPRICIESAMTMRNFIMLSFHQKVTILAGSIRITKATTPNRNIV